MATQPTNIVDGQAGHAQLHNDANTEINRLAAMLDAIPLGTSNLDAIQTPGIYWQDTVGNATLANNYPVAGATGVLRVEPYSATVGQVIQTLTISSNGLGAGSVAYGRRWSGTWSAWRPRSGMRTDATAGRAYYVWDLLNAREQLDSTSDTGWRDVTAAGWLANGWTATSIFARRIGYMVMLSIESLNASAMTNIDALANTPAGWRPHGTLDRRPLLHAATVPASIYRMIGTTVAGATTATPVLNGTIQWTTPESWPTTLPGTAVGIIPFQ